MHACRAEANIALAGALKYVALTGACMALNKQPTACMGVIASLKKYEVHIQTITGLCFHG